MSECETIPVPRPEPERDIQVRAFGGITWVCFGEYVDLDRAREAIRVVLRGTTLDGSNAWALIEAHSLNAGRPVEQWAIGDGGQYVMVYPTKEGAR